MNDYYDWAYITYYFSPPTQPGSSRTQSRPTSERADDAQHLTAPAVPADVSQERSAH